MIRTEEANLLESAGSSIVGTVDRDGMPDAARAWGTWVGDGGVRFLLSASASRSLDNLRGVGLLALTVTEVRTLRSVQVKGRATRVEDATEEDLAATARYSERFFTNVHEADGSPIEALQRLLPRAFVAVECTVDAVFDQTPGPSAGLRLAPT